MTHLLNNKGSVIPLVLGVFVFVSTLSFIVFNSVWFLTLLVNRTIEADEFNFQQQNTIEVVRDVILANPDLLNNWEIITEIFDVEVSITFDVFIFRNDQYELFILASTTFPGQGQNRPPFLPPGHSYNGVLEQEITRREE